jgi:hypothetical protein
MIDDEFTSAVLTVVWSSRNIMDYPNIDISTITDSLSVPEVNLDIIRSEISSN